MSTMDKNGRSWAKLSELRGDDTIELDGGFTCHRAGLAKVRATDGKLWFRCADGEHFLDGQADDGEHCVGVYKVTT